MKNLVLISLALVLLSSCQTSNLAVDYDNAYDFSKVKTYNYYTDNTVQMNRIDSANFVRNLDTALRAKGLVKDTENPDIFIALQVYNREGNQTNTVNLGVGGGSGWFGLGTNVGIPIRKKIMDYSIQVDFDDAQTRTLVWTGKTSNSLSYNASTDSKNSFYKTSVQSLLKKYPPQSKSGKKVKNNYYN